MRSMKLTAVEYHRNGVGGEGFHAVAFTFREDGAKHRMIATVFTAGDIPDGEVGPCTGRLAVLDADLAAAGKLGRAPMNQWRSDNFEPTIRQWIAQYTAKQAEELKASAARIEASADLVDI